MLDKTPPTALQRVGPPFPQSLPAMTLEELEANETRIFHAVLGSVAQRRDLKLRKRRKDIVYADFDGRRKMVLTHEYLGICVSHVRNLGTYICAEGQHVVKYDITTEGGALLSQGTLYCVTA
jgi:hypothetical protein